MQIKIFTSLVLGLLMSGGVWSQVTGGEFETPNLARVQAQRVAYITQRLALTPEESSTFWAVVNEYENKQTSIKQKYKPSKNVQLMTDQEAEAFIQSTFSREEELLDLKKEYFERFKQILPPSKIALYPIAENEFKRVILKQLRENFQGRRGRN